MSTTTSTIADKLAHVIETHPFIAIGVAFGAGCFATSSVARRMVGPSLGVLLTALVRDAVALRLQPHGA